MAAAVIGALSNLAMDARYLFQASSETTPPPLSMHPKSALPLETGEAAALLRRVSGLVASRPCGGKTP